MIRDHYYPTESSETIRKAISNKKKDTSADKQFTITKGQFDILYPGENKSYTLNNVTIHRSGSRITSFKYTPSGDLKYEKTLTVAVKDNLLQLNAWKKFNLKIFDKFNKFNGCNINIGNQSELFNKFIK